ncbi:MAG TPA: endonuclease III [Firmicutes bacterium]|nr:endonuclease III [Bacillota bacterium]
MENRVLALCERMGTRKTGAGLLAHGAGEPLTVLVLALLSQATNDNNSLRAFRSLRARFPSWRQLVEAGVAEIAAAIQSGGLAQQKASRLQAILRLLPREDGEPSLRPWGGLEQEKLWKLLALPGVGPKTAACVMLFGFGRRAFPVDTHIARIVKRMGLAAENASASQIQASLAPVIPSGREADLHLALIAHGLAVCRARRPVCEDCCLADICQHQGLKKM